MCAWLLKQWVPGQLPPTPILTPKRAVKNKNFSRPYVLSHEPNMGEKVISDNWVKNSSDHSFFVKFPIYLELFEKNRSKCLLIADVFKVLITFLSLTFSHDFWVH